MYIMVNDRYVSAQEMETIKEKCGQKIIKFSDVQTEIRGWYEKYDLCYPDSSINNYRDSWYHYRKIWPEHSYKEIISQMATFDEHLQRAEKDAVVNLFQIISQDLEFWYLCDQICVSQTAIDAFDSNPPFKESEIDLDNAEWLDKCWRQFRDNSEVLAANILIYVVQKYLPCKEEFFREIQVLLHKIKNCTLLIRLNSSDIARLNQPGEYMDEIRDIYNSADRFLSRPVWLFLFEMYDLVRIHMK